MAGGRGNINSRAARAYGMKIRGGAPGSHRRRAGSREPVRRNEARKPPPRPAPSGASALLLPEAVAVLARRDEGFDHLGALEVAVELFELREPEVVARLVGVAPEV